MASVRAGRDPSRRARGALGARGGHLQREPRRALARRAARRAARARVPGRGRVRGYCVARASQRRRRPRQRRGGARWGGSDWEGAAPVTVGAVQLHSRERGGARRMRGALALLRVLRAALSPEQAAAAAVRRVLGFDAAPCAPGSAGAYEGRPPCTPCAPGSAAVLAGQEACVPCTAGFFRGGAGEQALRAVPRRCAHTTAARRDGRGGVHGARLVCEPRCTRARTAAECAPAPGGSFSCTCRPGYVGDGTRCDFMCGDGVRVEGEACDDGDVFPSDGCSAACEVEPGFVLRARGGPAATAAAGGGGVATGPRDACTCTLPAGECCARAYRRCLAEHGGECEACNRDLCHVPAALAATAGGHGGGCGGRQRPRAARRQRRRSAARRWRGSARSISRRARRRGGPRRAGGRGLAAEGGEGDSTTASPSVSGAAGMGGSCVTRYSACLRLKACGAQSQHHRAKLMPARAVPTCRERRVAFA